MALAPLHELAARRRAVVGRALAEAVIARDDAAGARRRAVGRATARRARPRPGQQAADDALPAWCTTPSSSGSSRRGPSRTLTEPCSASPPARLPPSTAARTARTAQAEQRGAVAHGPHLSPSTRPRKPSPLSSSNGMTAPFVLSVLDQSPISEGSTGADALRNTLDLARLADALGYHRYWVAEHHGGPMLAGASPEVADRPDRRRDPAHPRRQRRRDAAALQPAEGRRELQHPRRPLPRTASTSASAAPRHRPATTLRPPARPPPGRARRLPQQLAELLAYLEGELPAGHPFAPPRRSCPACPSAPEPWLLGSSPQSGLWAAELGLPYAFADFINPTGAAIAHATASSSTPGARRRRTSPSACGRSAPTPTRRPSRLAASARMALALLRRGRPIASRAGQGAALSRVRGPGARRHAARAAHGGRLAADRGRGPARGRRGVRRPRSSIVVSHHSRPRRPPALLGAHRRGLRPRRRARPAEQIAS